MPLFEVVFRLLDVQAHRFDFSKELPDFGLACATFWLLQGYWR
jgi:hypothetical protein